MTRRELLEKTGAAALAGTGRLLGAGESPARYFGLHPFIEANPKAVFIRRTNVPAKMDSESKREEGLKLAREIFVRMDKPGVPVSHRVVLKPNVISVRQAGKPNEQFWGTGTDPDFYEGVVMGLKEVGLEKFHFLEANLRQTWNYRGYVAINRRHGVEMNQCARSPEEFAAGEGMTWSKVPDGVIFRRIPHYAPVNEPDTWLLNIAKWKAHGMCLTLSVKNEQGLVVIPYVLFCSGWKTVTGVPEFMKGDIRADAEQRINRYFESHQKMGYARYDSGAELSPIRQEIWAHKTMDNMSVLKTGLAMIEGIYGRDGDGFGIGTDYMTNLVMFSKDKFRLDLAALWLGGHEPGNVHWCRIAKERGLADTFNPWDVTVYEWKDGKALPRKLSDFPRTPLKTYYLRRDGEPEYHLVDEPFDYDKVKI
ncbi:MAG: DUF362 domain-containing protein [Bryobacteraceae bacterium]|nr:DUF362 domain-containing protein [Bryobacteraceae bacterium]